MCGIAGVYWRRTRPSDGPRVASLMADALYHRGPDSAGCCEASFADVGFRRLAIIDLSSGDQPLANEDGSIQCFLNGEIYNYRDLRVRLERRGHTFLTTSDTEVLPHLYEELGTDMFATLNGMFAICIVDHRQRQIILARDQIGVKQMYYTVSNDCVVFASEVKGLLASGLVAPEVDRSAVMSYLTLFYVPEPRTVLRGVHKLPPGSFLRLAQGTNPEPMSYYRPPAVASPNDRDPELAVAETRHLLMDAVRLQLQADVPVGISLSGGVDSSAIAYFASLTSGSSPTAFTVDWPGTPESEVEGAQDLCQRLGLSHRILRPKLTDLVQELPLLAWMSDEPIADPAMYSQFVIARAAAEHVKVLLTGAGGDELFGGYYSYQLSAKRAWYVRLPRPLRRAMRPLARLGGLSLDEIEALDSYSHSRLLWHASAMTSIDSATRALLARHLTPSADAFVNFQHWFAEYQTLEPTCQQMLVDLRTYLPDQVLPMVDRATMAASIEARVPLLDVRLVDHVFSLSTRTKLGQPPVPKRLLKLAIKDGVPEATLVRPKAGLPSPLATLVRNEWNRTLRAALLGPSSFVRTLLPREWLTGLLATRESALSNSRVLYSLLVLELWHRVFVVDRAVQRPTVGIEEILSVPSLRSAGPSAA
jgi:asparagine synthase (glutamine-hydrolysing)